MLGSEGGGRGAEGKGWEWKTVILPHSLKRKRLEKKAQVVFLLKVFLSGKNRKGDVGRGEEGRGYLCDLNPLHGLRRPQRRAGRGWDATFLCFSA